MNYARSLKRKIKMWAVIKIDKKKISSLKEDFTNKLGTDYTIYSPKIIVQKYKNNKLINKEFDLLGDYLFCFHKDFQNPITLNKLKFTRGLKYFLNGFKQSQEDIKDFVTKCKDSENIKGYLSTNFLNLKITKVTNLQPDHLQKQFLKLSIYKKIKLIF